MSSSLFPSISLTTYSIKRSPSHLWKFLICSFVPHLICQMGFLLGFPNQMSSVLFRSASFVRTTFFHVCWEVFYQFWLCVIVGWCTSIFIRFQKYVMCHQRSMIRYHVSFLWVIWLGYGLLELEIWTDAVIYLVSFLSYNQFLVFWFRFTLCLFSFIYKSLLSPLLYNLLHFCIQRRD